MSFGDIGGLGVQEKLREQACDDEAHTKGASAHAQRVEKAAQDAQAKATAAWNKLATEANACTGLQRSDRDGCIEAVETWLSVARSMSIELGAGVEAVETACGRREPAFPGESRAVAALEVSTAEDLLKRLKAADPKEPAKPTTTTSSPSTPGVLAFTDLPRPEQSAAYREKAHEKRIASINFLKDILAKGTASGSQKAEMMLRVADLSFEEARYLAQAGNPDSTRWMESAVKLYQAIVSDYPAYGRVDEATYHLGMALLDLGREEESVKQFTNLVRQYPDSGYVPDAYVQVGEYYFSRSSAYKALLAYQKATKFKSSKLYVFATYKLAWCYFNVGEYGKALDLMKAAVSLTRTSDSIDAATSKVLDDAALSALVRFFRDTGESDAGRAYFRQVQRPDLANQL